MAFDHLSAVANRLSHHKLVPTVVVSEIFKFPILEEKKMNNPHGDGWKAFAICCPDFSFFFAEKEKGCT